MDLVIFEKIDKIAVDSELRLREITLKDTFDLYQCLQDEETTQFIIPTPHQSIADTEVYISKIHKRFIDRKQVYYGIEHMYPSKLIGFICLHTFNERNKSLKIGYVLHKDYRGSGVMAKSIKKIITYTYDKTSINRIAASISPDNMDSIKLVERLYFQLEGYLRQYSYNQRTKQLEDRLIYSMLRSDIKRW